MLACDTYTTFNPKNHKAHNCVMTSCCCVLRSDLCSCKTTVYTKEKNERKRNWWAATQSRWYETNHSHLHRDNITHWFHTFCMWNATCLAYITYKLSGKGIKPFWHIATLTRGREYFVPKAATVAKPAAAVPPGGNVILCVFQIYTRLPALQIANVQHLYDDAHNLPWIFTSAERKRRWASCAVRTALKMYTFPWPAWRRIS